VADNYEVSVGEVWITADRGLLANDSDADGDAMSVVLTRQPTQGAVVLEPNGAFRYITKSKNTVYDTFDYLVTAGVEESAVVTVSVRIRGRLQLTEWSPAAGGNGHFYGTFNASSFEDARRQATEIHYRGSAGHLTTLTTAAENAATARYIGGRIGGYQDKTAADYSEPAGGWRWVTGEPMDFTAWGSREPNNFSPSEEFIESYSGVWNDNSDTAGYYSIEFDSPQAVAGDDLFFTPTGTVLEKPAGALLANDTPLPDAPGSAALVSGPSHGSLTLAADGSFRYTPAAGYAGRDKFTYHLDSVRGLSNVATVELLVGRGNYPTVTGPDPISLLEDQPREFGPGLESLLWNDQDLDGWPLTATLVALPQHGRLSEREDGVFVYMPDPEYSGPDRFSYRATDGYSVSEEAWVELTIYAVDDKTVVGNDAYRVPTTAVLTVDATHGLLANDRDIDSTQLSVYLGRAPWLGQLTLNEDGSFVYTPGQDFAGVDSFEYRTNDSSLGIVYLRSDLDTTRPLTFDDSYWINNSGIYAEFWPADGVLKNDASLSVEPLTVFLVGLPTHGTLSLGDDGSFKYLPDRGFAGADAFWYQATDGHSYSLPTRVDLQVNDSFANWPSLKEWSTDVGGNGNVYLLQPWDLSGWSESTNIILKGRRAHAATVTSAAERDWIAATFPDAQFWLGGYQDFSDPGAQQPAGGWRWVTGEPWNYTAWAPNEPDDVGAEPRWPAHQLASVAAGWVDENSGWSTGALWEFSSFSEFFPFVADDLAKYVPGQSLARTAQTGVLTNDVLPSTGRKAELVRGPAHGQLTLSPDGAYVYTPAAGFSGFDRFRYRVMDGEVELGQAEVWLKPIAANLPPISSNDAYALDEDQELAVNTQGGVLANDYDSDGRATLSIVSLPEHGVLDLQLDGSFVYRPNPDFFGVDRFVYRYTDELGAAADATASIEVRPINDPAVVAPDFYVAPRLGTLQVPAANGVLSNDHDVDTVALAATLIVQPQHGALNLATDGSFTYEPDETFTGADTFEYRPEDGSGTNQQVRVILTWQTDSKLPIALGDQFTFEEFGLVERRVLDNDYDPQGRPLTAALVRKPEHGRVSLADDGKFYYLPEGGFSGRDSFWYVARSAGGDSLPAEVRIEVSEGASPSMRTWSFAEGGNGHAYARISVNPPWYFDWGVANQQAEQVRFFGTQARLASITSQAEQEWIVNNLQDPYEDAWLGGYGDVGGWHWTSGEPWEYSNWAAEPSVSASMFVVLQSARNAGAWYAFNTSAREYIAEVPLPAAAQLAGDDVYTAPVGASIEIASYADLLANDWNSPGSNVQILSEPTQGSLIRTASGGLQYLPAVGFKGRDRFTYRVSGPGGASNAATVWLNSGTNDFAPDLIDVAYHVEENDLLATTPGQGKPDYYQPFDGPSLPAEFEGDRFGVTNGVVARANWEYDRYYRWLRTRSTDYASQDFTYEVTFNTNFAREYDLFGASILGLGRGAFVDGASERELVDSLYVRFSRVDRNGGVVQLYNQWSQPLATLGSISVAGVHRARIEKIGDEVTFSIDVSYDGLFKADMSYTVPSLKAAVPKLDDTNTRLFMVSAVGDDWFDDVSIVSLPRHGLSDYAADPERGALEFVVVEPPAHGELSLAANGSFRYTPNPDFVGVDRFRYTANDGALTSYPATATIVVEPGSGAPLARPDQYRVAKNGQLVVDGPWTAARQISILASNLEWNEGLGKFWAFDSDRQAMRAIDPLTGQVSDPEPASIPDRAPLREELRIGDRLVFTNTDEVLDATTRQSVGKLPQRGVNTVDEARERIYTLRGDQLFVVDERSLKLLSTLVVPDVPIVGNTRLLRWGDNGLAFLSANGRIVLLESNLLAGPRPSGVAENDRGRNDAGLAISVVQAPQSGDLSLSSDGSFRYAPKPGFVGQDRFVYRLTTSAGTSESEAVILVEPSTAPPQTTADRYELRQSRVLLAAPEIGVLANDAEGMDRKLTVELVTGPSHGALRLDPDGSFHYEPQAGFAGLDTFVYRATDGQLRSAPTEVQLQVHPTLAQVELRAVRSRTANRSVLELPNSETSVFPGEQFYLEVWLQVQPGVVRDNNIGNLDLYFSASGLQFVEPDWDEVGFSHVNWIDRSGGKLDDFSSRVPSLDLFAAPTWARMGSFKFRSAGLGPVSFTLAPGYYNEFAREWSDVSLGSLTLSTFAGDTNYDNRVDLTDFGALKGNFGLPSGATALQGDFNGDGRVDLSDFGLLKQNFGEEAVGAKPIAPPVFAAVASSPVQRAVDASMAGPGDFDATADDADLFWLAWERNRHAVGEESQAIDDEWAV